MDNNIYAAPESDLDDANTAAAIMRQLLEEQSIAGSIIGVLLAIVPSLLFISLFNYRHVVSILVMVVPGIVVAQAVKFLGQPFALTPRLLATSLTAVVMTGYFIWLAASWPFHLMVPINAAIVLASSRRRLNVDQERALYQYQLGRLTVD